MDSNICQTPSTPLGGKHNIIANFGADIEGLSCLLIALNTRRLHFVLRGVEVRE